MTWNRQGDDLATMKCVEMQCKVSIPGRKFVSLDKVRQRLCDCEYECVCVL